MPRFVWNDETITNSYGFRVLNSGISLARFKTNPVMQNSHKNTTADNLGKWKEWKTEGFQMSGETVFDSERPVVAEVEGQVNRGFIKACSMGLGIGWDEDSWQKAPDGTWELAKAELMEVSICAVPSLSNALALYDIATGELIAEEQIKLSMVNLSAKQNEKLNQNIPKMEKINLTTDAAAFLLSIGLSNCDNPATISNAIMTLKGEKEKNDRKVIDLEAKLEKQTKERAEALIDGAIANEQLTAGDKEEWMELATANYTLAAKQVAKLPGKVSLNGKVVNLNDADDKVKSLDDFEKLELSAQIAFKKDNPEKYKALFA